MVFNVHLLYGPWPLGTGYMGWGQTCVAVKNSDKVGVTEGEAVALGREGGPIKQTCAQRPPVPLFPNGPLHLPARSV